MNSPVSIHAASRLGTPKINLLPADIFAGSPSGATTIGLRPEHLSIGEGLPAEVIRVEHLGDQTRLHLRLNGHDIITLDDAHTSRKTGETLHLQPRDALYFDMNGARLT